MSTLEAWDALDRSQHRCAVEKCCTHARKPRLSLRPVLSRTGLTVSELADLTGFHRDTVQSWKLRGVPADRADVLAVRLREHPTHFWPLSWWGVGV